MQRINISAHMVVKNEDRFAYYAIKSVLPFVDEFFICDTGSSDHTLAVIRSLKNDKIILENIKINNRQDLGKIRQSQLERTKTDWLWVVDGDEVYPKSLAEEISDIIETIGNKLEGIAVGRYDLLGDIYHYQSESVGTYNTFGRKGHNVLRLINKKNIPGLHVEGDYPYEGYYDNQNIEIIHHNPEKFRFTKGRLWHAMYLNRSTSGSVLPDTFHRKKYKIELGNKMPLDVKFPEVFFAEKPGYVSGVTAKRPLSYELLASAVTPIKMIKRALQKPKL